MKLKALFSPRVLICELVSLVLLNQAQRQPYLMLDPDALQWNDLMANMAIKPRLAIWAEIQFN